MVVAGDIMHLVNWVILSRVLSWLIGELKVYTIDTTCL